MPRPRTVDSPPMRRPVNLSVDASLLKEAREYQLNLSATLERALVEQLRQSRAERWLAENKDGIAAYNEFVEQHGVFSDALRTF